MRPNLDLPEPRTRSCSSHRRNDKPATILAAMMQSAYSWKGKPCAGLVPATADGLMSMPAEPMTSAPQSRSRYKLYKLNVLIWLAVLLAVVIL